MENLISYIYKKLSGEDIYIHVGDHVVTDITRNDECILAEIDGEYLPLNETGYDFVRKLYFTARMEYN